MDHFGDGFSRQNPHKHIITKNRKFNLYKALNRYETQNTKNDLNVKF